MILKFKAALVTSLTCVAVFIFAFAMAGFFNPSVSKPSQADTTIEIRSIYWSDGDSGRINGKIKFRLNDVDAPETGGVGAAIGGAKCELERERGFASKGWVVDLTKRAELEVTYVYDTDRHGRLVIDLSVDDNDLGKQGISAGHCKPWPHDGNKAKSKRPVWCENQ